MIKSKTRPNPPGPGVPAREVLSGSGFGFWRQAVPVLLMGADVMSQGRMVGRFHVRQQRWQTGLVGHDSL